MIVHVPVMYLRKTMGFLLPQTETETETENSIQCAVIGGGDGGCLRELLKHQDIIKNVSLVEIDEQVVVLCALYLPSVSHGESTCMWRACVQMWISARNVCRCTWCTGSYHAPISPPSLPSPCRSPNPPPLRPLPAPSGPFRPLHVTTQVPLWIPR